MNCVNCVDKKTDNCAECDTAFCDTCSKEHMYAIENDASYCDTCCHDIYMAETILNKIIIDGIEGIRPDQYDSSAIEYYYDAVANASKDIQKLFTKKRRAISKKKHQKYINN